MQLKYGHFPFDPNACTLTSTVRNNWNRGGQQYSQTARFEVQGYLSGTSQADLTDKETKLESALLQPYQDLLLFQDDGTTLSAEILTNANSITGVRVTDGPNFVETRGPEYATIRTFRFTAEAEYPLNTSLEMLLDFHESLTFWGGGPTYAFRRALNGPPQRQQVYPATEFSCVQQGSAVGYLAYPQPQPPKFPDALKESPKVSKKEPERKGQGYTGFEITWEYHFESASAMVGVPNLWIN